MFRSMVAICISKKQKDRRLNANLIPFTAEANQISDPALRQKLVSVFKSDIIP